METTKELIDELKLRGYFVSKVPPSVSGKTFKADIAKLRGDTYRFGVISCTHICSKHQQLSHLNTFYKVCKRKGIELILHCGDLIEGNGKLYRGQEYEMFIHGADEQVAYTVENYPKVSGIQTKVILGNHDESYLKSDGFNCVKAICEKREDMDYLGDYLAFVQLNGIKVAIAHSAGGVPYARSYRNQKQIEQFPPELKPHMLFVGHRHITNWLPMYRNVSGFEVGCFQSQTPFLTRLGLYPEIGGWCIEIKVNPKGIDAIKAEWVPFYVPIKDDF
jgi:predicted phosphodiesterase